jgi:hypothetical protein
MHSGYLLKITVVEEVIFDEIELLHVRRERFKELSEIFLLQKGYLRKRDRFGAVFSWLSLDECPRPHYKPRGVGSEVPSRWTSREMIRFNIHLDFTLHHDKQFI